MPTRTHPLHRQEPYIISGEESYIFSDHAESSCYLCLAKRRVAPLNRPLRSHLHPEIEIALFLSGNGNYVVNGRDYDLCAGDVFLFNSAQQHCINRIDGPVGLSYLTVHFEPRFIWSPGSDLFDARFLRVFNARDVKDDSRLPRNDPRTDEIISLLHDMARELELRNAEYELMVKALLLRLLVLLNRQFALESSPNPPSSNSHYKHIEQAMDYLRAHLDEPITLHQLASAAHLNDAYFSTLFKQLNSVTPWEYLTAKRIEQACVLLPNTRLSVMEIALRCGYNNAANFNRAFKKVTGFSPSEFRRSLEKSSGMP